MYWISFIMFLTKETWFSKYFQNCHLFDFISNDINNSWSSIKNSVDGGNTMEPRKGYKQYSNQLGGKET